MPRKRRTFEEWVNSPRVTGWLFVAMALACAAFAVSTYSDTAALCGSGVVTEAEVVEVHDGRDPYVVLRFRTQQGAEVLADVGNYYWDPTPQVGDRQTVLYDPAQPADNVADTRLGPSYLATWLLGVGGAAAAALVRPTFTGRIDWMRFRRG